MSVTDRATTRGPSGPKKMTRSTVRTVSKECEKDAEMMSSMCKYYFNMIIQGYQDWGNISISFLA